MSVDLVEEEDRENSLHAIKSPLKPLEQSRTVLTQSQKDNQVSLSYHEYIQYWMDMYIFVDLDSIEVFFAFHTLKTVDKQFTCLGSHQTVG